MGLHVRAAPLGLSLPALALLVCVPPEAALVVGGGRALPPRRDEATALAGGPGEAVVA
jgi:hypothetical protein